MSWKSLGVFVATIAFCMGAFCTGLAAQNEPFLGIWQINVEKTTNYPQQTQMIINVPAPVGFTSIRATIGKDGKSTTLTGRYITFWKKVKGEWKVALDASANEPPFTNGLPTP